VIKGEAELTEELEKLFNFIKLPVIEVVTKQVEEKR
jgi:hypothetical protein